MQEAKKSPVLAVLFSLAVGVITGLVRNLTDLPETPVLLGGIAVTVVILIALRQHAANVVVFCLGVVLVEIILKH